MSKKQSSPRFRFAFAALMLSALLFLLPAVRSLCQSLSVRGFRNARLVLRNISIR